MTAIRAMLRSAFASVIAGIALAGLVAMHGMDAGTSGSAHLMALPVSGAAVVEAGMSHNTRDAEPPSRVFRDTDPRMERAVSHNTRDVQPASLVFWDTRMSADSDAAAGTGMGTHSGPMCAIAPNPAHTPPGPAATPALVDAPGLAASVVAPIETRAADPPSLTALGVCRR